MLEQCVPFKITKKCNLFSTQSSIFLPYIFLLKDRGLCLKYTDYRKVYIFDNRGGWQLATEMS